MDGNVIYWIIYVISVLLSIWNLTRIFSKEHNFTVKDLVLVLVVAVIPIINILFNIIFIVEFEGQRVLIKARKNANKVRS